MRDSDAGDGCCLNDSHIYNSVFDTDMHINKFIGVLGRVLSGLKLTAKRVC